MHHIIIHFTGLAGSAKTLNLTTGMNLFHKCSICQLYNPLYFINITLLQYNCSMHSVNLINRHLLAMLGYIV